MRKRLYGHEQDSIHGLPAQGNIDHDDAILLPAPAAVDASSSATSTTMSSGGSRSTSAVSGTSSVTSSSSSTRVETHSNVRGNTFIDRFGTSLVERLCGNYYLSQRVEQIAKNQEKTDNALTQILELLKHREA